MEKVKEEKKKNYKTSKTSRSNWAISDYKLSSDNIYASHISLSWLEFPENETN